MNETYKLSEGTENRCCGCCNYFKYEASDGYGLCVNPKTKNHHTHCGCVCELFKIMEKTKEEREAFERIIREVFQV